MAFSEKCVKYEFYVENKNNHNLAIGFFFHFRREECMQEQLENKTRT